MDGAAWLCGLGLEQHAQPFRDNDIDGEIRCGMTSEDLKELGISSFGHHRRLLNAITALSGETPDACCRSIINERGSCSHLNSSNRPQTTPMVFDVVCS